MNYIMYCDMGDYMVYLTFLLFFSPNISNINNTIQRIDLK